MAGPSPARAKDQDRFPPRPPLRGGATHRIALASARAAGNRQGEAWVLSNLGDALGVTGQSEAIGQLERSLAIRRDIGDRRGEAQAANNLADAYLRLGRMDEALDRALASARARVLGYTSNAHCTLR